MTNVLGARLLFALAVFAVGWIGGWIPLARKKRMEAGGFMSCGNAFAAGIFLGTGLIHMLGEATGIWRQLGWSYPVAPLLTVVGFLAMLLVEHVLMPPSMHSVVHAHSGEELGAEEVKRLVSTGTPYALVLALSIHSLVAGLVLGAQEGLAEAIFIFVAIMAHKATAGLALGFALARSGVGKSRGRSVVTLFALMTPAGIIAGAVLGGLMRDAVGGYFDGVFLALAAGTFLYIASMDILQDEFLVAGGRFAKWFFAALAVALMALLSIWL